MSRRNTFSGQGRAATPTTAGPAATERSWDATDNQDTDLNAAAVEEAALGTECRTVNAHSSQRQFAPACHPRFNYASNFSSVVPYADSY